MGIIKGLIEKFRHRNDKEKELDEEFRAQTNIEEKHKSANERELERYGKETREKMIEKRLKWERAKRTKELWKTNLMKNNARCYIDNSIMKEKKMFLGVNKW